MTAYWRSPIRHACLIYPDEAHRGSGWLRVLAQESGALHLHNQEQLLCNLNEFILNKYELHATTLVHVHNASGREGGGLSGWWSGLSPSQRFVAPALIVGIAAAGTLAVIRVMSRKR